MNPHNDGRISFGRLKWMAESPMHYQANPEPDSDVLARGRAVHSQILGGQKVVFYEKVSDYAMAIAAGRQVLTYENRRAGKDWEAFKTANPLALILSPKELDAELTGDPSRSSPRSGEAWLKFEAEHREDVILTRKQYDNAGRIVDAIRAHAGALDLLTGADSVREETLLFDMLGLPCRSTPDSRRKGLEVELKIVRSAKPTKYRFQSRAMWWHAQHALHIEAINRCKHDKDPEPFTVAVEASEPYPVTIFRYTPGDIEKGGKSLRLWMESLKGCLASDSWPPYSQAVVDVDIPDDDGPMFNLVANDNDTAPFMQD